MRKLWSFFNESQIEDRIKDNSLKKSKKKTTEHYNIDLYSYLLTSLVSSKTKCSLNVQVIKRMI